MESQRTPKAVPGFCMLILQLRLGHVVECSACLRAGVVPVLPFDHKQPLWLVVWGQANKHTIVPSLDTQPSEPHTTLSCCRPMWGSMHAAFREFSGVSTDADPGIDYTAGASMLLCSSQVSVMRVVFV